MEKTKQHFLLSGLIVLAASTAIAFSFWMYLGDAESARGFVLTQFLLVSIFTGIIGYNLYVFNRKCLYHFPRLTRSFLLAVLISFIAVLYSPILSKNQWRTEIIAFSFALVTIFINIALSVFSKIKNNK